MVRGQGFQSIEALAGQFGVTPQTIRRDVNQLCDRGLLRRRHGGVELPPLESNLAYSDRKVMNLEAKRRIAALVARQIPDGASISLGIGTTPEQVARALLDHSNLVVVTNNLNAAVALAANPTAEIVVAGGRLRNLDLDVMGGDTPQFFERFRVDYAIFGVGAVDADGSLLDFHLDEVRVRMAMAANCRQRFLVLDHSKFGRAASVRGGRLDEVSALFTDRQVPPAATATLAAAGVAVHVWPERNGANSARRRRNSRARRRTDS